MERDNNCKRKATSPTPDEANATRRSKSKKPNDAETEAASTQQTATCNSSGKAIIGGCELTQKLVAMWVGGTHGHHPFMTQEVRESVTLKDAKEKCAEAENLNLTLRNKVKTAENTLNDLRKTLKAEEKIKTELVSKLNLTGDVASTIMEHINYITDTLQRCQQHKDHLSDLYNNIILKQRENYNCVKAREEKLQEQLRDLRGKLHVLEANLAEVRNSLADESNEMKSAFEAELRKIRDEYEKTLKELKVVSEENMKIRSSLKDKESCSLELEKKIAEYEELLRNQNERLARTSATLESIVAEKSQIEKELAEKNLEILKISGDLESSTTKNNELSVELSTIRDKNSELESSIKCEADRRQNLAKNFEAATERSEELARHVEKLKDEKEDAIREMKKKIAETESRLLSEAKRKIEELESNHESLLKQHVEKYETCLAEMKLIEARHESELSRVSVSSSSALQSAAAENRRLEELVESLKREKNELQVEMKQIEDLLLKHANSERQLRVKLDECQAESAKHAAAAANAQAEQKRGEQEKLEKICKIKELEKELLNLQVRRNLPTSDEKPKTLDSGTADRKGKERVKKPPASSIYKKSILKRDSKPRKTRSSPPSPIAVASVAATNPSRKITFNFDSSSEGSPVKLSQTTAISNFIDDGGDLFNDLVGTGMSSSQPMQASQTLYSQRQPTTRKFFKSRASQSK